MGFAVKDFLLEDTEFMNNPNVHFVFLLRKPHDTTISFYKKMHRLDKKLNDLIGYQSSYEIFEKVKDVAVNKPVIIFTEDLYNNPQETVRMFCDCFNIPFLEQALHWQNLGENFTGAQEWSEIKHPEHAHHWHGDAIKSTGISKPTSYKVDLQGNPTFEEIADTEHREAYKTAYEINKV